MKLKLTIRRCARCRYPVQGDGYHSEGKLFCSKSCCEIFILDQINRGHGQFRCSWLALVISLGVLMGMMATDLRAQHHSPYHKDFYQHWRVPTNPSESCCNARITHQNGAETGDCEPTQAKIIKGDWWAWVRQKNEWVKIPDERIVRYPNPNIFEAHICWTFQRGVICFKAPDTGG